MTKTLVLCCAWALCLHDLAIHTEIRNRDDTVDLRVPVGYIQLLDSLRQTIQREPVVFVAVMLPSERSSALSCADWLVGCGEGISKVVRGGLMR